MSKQGAATVEVPLEEIRRRFPNNRLDGLLEMLCASRFQALFALQQALGAEVYLVGGIIRDSIVGSPPKDFDFVVRFPDAQGNVDPGGWVQRFEDFFGTRGQEGLSGQAVIRGPHGRMTLCGTSFGVYKLLPHGSVEELDIAFPRTDHAPAGTLGSARDIVAQSNPGMPFEQDVLRRDFTINGGALRLTWAADGGLTATFLDCVGALADLECAILRAIGDPRDRINESLDRILRAVRFAQQGFRMEESLAAAIRAAVAGDGINPETRALRRRRPDGRYVVAREIIAVNLLKSLTADAAGTLEALADLGMLQDIFPDFLALHPPARLPQMSAELRRRIAQESRSVPLADRNHEYEKALAAVRRHQAAYPDCSMDEIVYLLTFWLGRYPALARVTADGRVIYADTYRELSQLLLPQLIGETALDSLPATSKYKLHPRRLQEWLNRHGVAIGLLGDIAPPKPLDAQRMAALRWVFPELTGDPFWRIFQSILLTSPEAVAAKANLPLLAAQLQAVEAFDAETPRPARDLLDARALQEVFYLRDRVIKVALERSEDAYRQVHLDHGFVSEARAKRAMLRAVLTTAEIRIFLRERTITADDVRAVLPSLPEDAERAPAGQATEILKRSMVRVIERQATLRYTGETWDEVVAEEPALGALNARRAVGRASGEIKEFGVYLSEALAERPADVLEWLTRSFARPDSFASRLLPELRVLIGFEPGGRACMAGDVRQLAGLLLAYIRRQAAGGEVSDHLAYRLGLDRIGGPDRIAN